MTGDSSPRLFVRLAIFAAVTLVAWLVGWILLSFELVHPHAWHLYDAPDMFYYLLFHYESVGTWITLATSVLFIFVPALTQTASPFSVSMGWRTVIIIAGFIFFTCLWGAHTIYGTFPATLDENVAFFQAHIFESGHVLGKVPDADKWLGDAILPEFIIKHPDGTIIEAYLPVYACLLALSDAFLGSAWTLNPLLSGCSILLIYAIARNLRDVGAIAGWGVLFLATSCQFIINGMSGYAMTSHLFFSLLWLFFYSHPERRMYFAAPLIGVLAIGLHQPVCHILFVLPFLIRLVLDRRWMEAAYSATIYVMGGIGWIAWMHFMRPQANQLAETLFGFPGIELIGIHLPNILLLINWQNFMGALLFIAALYHFRSMPTIVRDLMWGAALTFAFYLFFLDCQGAGWGYRYMFPVLGNLCLIAAWAATRCSIPKTAVILSTLLVICVQFPFRCNEVATTIERKLTAYREISQLNADYVVVDTYEGWYSDELVRNNPDFSNRPLFLFKSLLSGQQTEELTRHHRVVFIDRDAFMQMHIRLVH